MIRGEIIKKRGQVTLFVVIGICILIAVSLILFFREKTLVISTPSDDVTPTIKVYTESLLSQVAESAVYRTSLQGGYLDPAGNSFYKTSPARSWTVYQGSKVPVLTDIPESSFIEENLKNYITIEFIRKYNPEVFPWPLQRQIPDFSTGYYEPDYLVLDISAGETVSVHLTYPIVIDIGTAQQKLSDSYASVPVRLGFIRDSASVLVQKMKSSWENGEVFNLEAYPCPSGNIKIYAKDFEEYKIIELMEYNPPRQTFIYRFALFNKAGIKGERCRS